MAANEPEFGPPAGFTDHRRLVPAFGQYRLRPDESTLKSNPLTVHFELGACRPLVVEARIWLLEDRFSTNCRRIAPPWVKIRRIVDQADEFAARPTKVRQAPSPERLEVAVPRPAKRPQSRADALRDGSAVLSLSL